MYVLLLERLERHVLAERQVAATLAAAGVNDVTAPVLDDELARFDAALAEEPEPESESASLLRQLGVA